MSLVGGVVVPTLFDRSCITPIRRVNIMETKPVLDLAPNPNHVTTLIKEVGHRFLGVLAKSANVTVWPPTPLKPVHHPNPVC